MKFIIWTNQRSGGTNLANRLMMSTQSCMVEHEPFNLPRKFGHLTAEITKSDRLNETEFVESKFLEALKNQINIKHCVEMVPWIITNGLLKASSKLGYKNILLHRSNSYDRLLSLFFAKETGAWGPASAQKINSDKMPCITNSQICSLFEHELKCIELLQTTRNFFQDNDVEFHNISFEEIYEQHNPDAKNDYIIGMLKYLDIFDESDEKNKLFVQRIVDTGNQKTKHLYKKLENSHLLKEKLEKISGFRD